jgi:hypothetical protein
MSLTKYKIFCIEEQSWTEGWLSQEDGPPTQCFNNNGHEVNLNSFQELDSTQVLTVKIEEESIKTGGHYTVEGHQFTALANTDTSYTVSWPMPVSVTVVNVQTTDENNGDVLNSIVNPNTICGVITSNFEIGGKTISVNSTVTANVKIGWEIIIGSEYLGRIIAIDLDNFFITLENATTVYHQIGSPVFTQVRVIKNFQLGTRVGNQLGVSNIGGKYLKTGTTTKVTYTNNSNVNKQFRFSIEYLF